MSRKVLGISANELINIFSKPSGLQSHHNCFSVKAIPWKSSPVGLDPNKDLRVMFVAGKKKLGKLAVYRNRAQRRVKTSVSEHFLDMAPKGNRLPTSAPAYSLFLCLLQATTTCFTSTLQLSL